LHELQEIVDLAISQYLEHEEILPGCVTLHQFHDEEEVALPEGVRRDRSAKLPIALRDCVLCW
jgi:hypothetical protein